VVEVNLMAPVYWALEMVGRIAEARHKSGVGHWKPEEGIQAQSSSSGQSPRKESAS